MKIIRFISILSLVGAFISNAYAGTDGKTYPGAMCRTNNTSENSISRKIDGGIYNYSMTQSRKIYCPVVHDDLTFRSRFQRKNAAISYARVRVIDNNNASNQNVYCSIYGRSPDQNGNFMSSRDFKDSTGASPNVQRLDMIHTSDRFYTYSFFAVEIECTLPPAQIVNGRRRDSGLMSYVVYENAF